MWVQDKIIRAKTPLIPVLYTTVICLAGVGILPLSPLVRVHLALAVAIMPLIFTAMLYFSPTLSRTPPASGKQTLPPWLALAASILAVTGFALQETLLPAALLLALLATTLLSLGLQQRRNRCLGTPHGGLLWYQLALGCLLAGLLAMLTGLLIPTLYPALRLVHLHLNLLGFVAITALGTLHVLFPTLAGSFDPNTAKRLHQDWPLALAAPLLIAVGSGWWSPLAMLGGVLGVIPPLRLIQGVWRHRYPLWQRGGAAHALLAALLGYTALWPLALFMTNHHILVQFFIIGFLLPLINGATAHLLPLWWQPQPEQAPWRQTAQKQLARFAGLRGIIFHLAAIALLLDFPWSWPLAGVAMATFIIQGVFVGLTQTNPHPVNGPP